jgi:hypothetical protein
MRFGGRFAGIAYIPTLHQMAGINVLSQPSFLTNQHRKALVIFKEQNMQSLHSCCHCILFAWHGTGQLIPCNHPNKTHSAATPGEVELILTLLRGATSAIAFCFPITGAAE